MGARVECLIEWIVWGTRQEDWVFPRASPVHPSIYALLATDVSHDLGEVVGGVRINIYIAYRCLCQEGCAFSRFEPAGLSPVIFGTMAR